MDRKISLQVVSDTRKAQADIKRLQAQLTRLSNVKLGAGATGKMTAGMARLGTQTKHTTSQMDKLGSRINTVFNIAVVLGFSNAIAKAGDSILNLSNQLKSSGVEAKNLGNNIAFTLRTANETRTSFKSAGVLLARMTRSTATLGFGMKDVQKATTTVIKGFQLAGATTQEATQSVVQLSQGLASGALRGDELRSVLEGAPVLAASIAKELGVGVGQLRDMGKQGKITSEVVMRALLNDADALDAKFAEMKPTFEGAFEVLKNGLTASIGEATNLLGDAIGIKTAFMDAGKALTEAFLDGRVRVAVGEFVRDAREASAKIKGFFSNIFADFGLDIPDLSSILAGLATLLGMKTLRRGGGTAFTPIRADVAGLDKQVDGLTQKLNKGFIVGKTTGLGLLQQGLGQTKASTDALRSGLTKGFTVGRVAGLSGLQQTLGQATTSVNALRSGLTKGFSVGRISGLDAVFQNIGLAKASATNLRANLVKDFPLGKLTGVDGITTPLATIATQMRTLRQNLGKKFVLGETESSGNVGGGFLLAPTRQPVVPPVVAPDLAPIAEATKVVNGYANSVSRFFGNIATNIGAMAEKTDFKLGVLDKAIEKNSKGLDRATKRYTKHAGAVDRLGLLYDGLSDKDVFADKGTNLAKRMDAESAEMNKAKASMDRYNGALEANKAARGSFITGLEAQQKAFTKTQRVFARMAGVMNVQLPTLRAGFDKLATTATNVGNAFSTMATKAGNARTKMSSAMGAVGKVQGSLAGQVGGTVGATVLLSEFFTFNDDTKKFETEVVEKVRSGISNALSNYTPLDTDQANLGAKLATIIGGAIGAFVVVSTVAGAISAMLLTALASPLVATAAVAAFTVYLATSETELADQIRSALVGAMKQIGTFAFKVSADGIEAVLNAPVNAITGSEGTIQDRQSKAIIKNNEDGNFLDSALIASSTGTLFRGMTEQQVADARGIWQKELDGLMEGNAFERFINSGQITTFSDAIEQAEGRLNRIAQSKIGQDTGVPLRPSYGNLLPPSPIKKALGGFISGAGTGTSDSIPAMLSDGEFVMKASAVSKFGPDFMSRINAGILPQFFSDGGGVKANPEALQRLYDEQAIDTKKVGPLRKSAGSHLGLTSGADRFLLDALELNIAERGADIAQLESQGAKASSGSSAGSGSGASTGSGGSGGNKPPKKSEAETIGEKYAKGFENDFASGLKKAFRDGDIKGFLTGLLDSFTGKVIDSFVDGLTNSLFEGISGEGGILSNFFGGMSETGSKLGKGKAKKPTTEKADGEKAVSGIGGVFENAQSWMSGLFSEGGSISGIFSGFSEGLGGIFSSLGGMFGGMGGGGSGILGALGGMGGGGGLFSSLTGGTFGSFLGFSQGGTVPNTSTSQAGKDSVPAMLMPGEVVLSKSQLANTNNQAPQSVVNQTIQITGDVSRQTRIEMVKMLPQLAQGVNMHNKENNYKR